MEINGTNLLRKLRRDWWKTRICTSCVSPLGRIIARGGICSQCGLKFCKNCRQETQPGSGVWVCLLCSNGGISSDIFGKTKSLGRDSRSIRRSWTISTPQRAQTNSPILKSYTVIQPEETLSVGGTPNFNTTGLYCDGSGQACGSIAGGSQHSPSNNGANAHRQFHSLPRMSSGSERSKKTKRSFNQDFEKENIKRHRSFQSTLHPYQVPATPPSPSASINFIEDSFFWDYYDYDIDSSSPLSGSPRTSGHHHHHQRNHPTRFRSLLTSSSGGGGSASILQRRNSIRNKLESDMDRLLKLNLRTSHSNRSSCERSLGDTYDCDYSKNYSYSNYNSLSDTELNDNSKYDQEENSQITTAGSSSRRFRPDANSTNFYKFASVTPVNMSPMSDTRKEASTSTTNTASNIRTTNNNLFSTNSHPSTSTPVKPERKCNAKRSCSLNSYDGKKLFSPLRTYVVVMKENVVPRANNISANANSVTSTSSLTGENNSSNMKAKNQHGSNNATTSNTSNNNIRINSSKEEEFNINNSATKFHSLPRERVIRIEREDAKFSPSRQRQTNSISQNSSNSSPTSVEDRRGRNVSKIEITRSMSSASGKDFQSTGGNNGSKFPIEKNSGRRIVRSQSHREISSANKHHHHPSTIITYDPEERDRTGAQFLSVVNLRSSPNSGPNSAGVTRLHGYDSATLPLIRTNGKSVSTTLTSANQAPPLLSSLLDDKTTAAVMENFLRSPSQNLQNPVWTSSPYKIEPGNSSGGRPTPNEKCFIPTSKKSSDFVQSQMTDFQNFQREQIQTFDNYLRQCSTFPRVQKQKHNNLKSQQESAQEDKSFEPEPKCSRVRHTSTTLINSSSHDDFVKSWDDNLDQQYFQPIGATSRARARSEVQLNRQQHYNNSNNDGYHPSTSTTTVDPIVFMKQSDSTVGGSGAGGGSRGRDDFGIGPTPPIGWSATLPHPYVRKHRQQKSFFLNEQHQREPVPPVDDAFSKEKTRISNVEQEIERDIELSRERDIYFQKTKSLDRVRPSRVQKTSIFDTKFEQDVEVADPFMISDPPVASPRLRRKAKLTSNPDVHASSSSNVPKINPEQKHRANGTGTNYPLITNKNNNSHFLPNEPRASRDLKSSTRGGETVSPSSHSAQSQSNANKFILENQSQFANHSNSLTNPNTKSSKLSGTNKSASSADIQISNSNTGSASELTKSKMKMTTNYNQKSGSSELSGQQQQVVDKLSGDLSSPAPIATPRTRRKNSNHQKQRDAADVEIELDGTEALPTTGNNVLPKAVRFEQHIIEMTEENERKHNKGSSRTNTNNAANPSPVNNNFNKLRAHLGTSGDDIEPTTNSNNIIGSVPISSQFDSDHYASSSSRATKGVYSSTNSGVSDNKTLTKSNKKSPHNNNSGGGGGFVARAIAKVKSKANKNSKKGHKANLNSRGLRSIETRDSITYISPSPTQLLTQQQKQQHHQNHAASVIQEITLNPIIALSPSDKNDYFNNSTAADHSITRSNSNAVVRDSGASVGVARSESFTKAGILKNSFPTEQRPLNKTPQKPKRSFLKKNSAKLDPKMEQPFADDDSEDLTKVSSLSVDQLTPSSTSSSASSYLSNVQESYEFFHASEECESIDGEEEEALGEIGEAGDESDQIFKSFEDDEDAGEDFIFYSQMDSSPDNSNKTKARMTSHAYQQPKTNLQNHNQIVSSNQNNNQNTNYRETLVGSSIVRATSSAKSLPKDITTTTNSPHTNYSLSSSSHYGDRKSKKGLTSSRQVVVLGNNGQDTGCNLLRNQEPPTKYYADDDDVSASEFHYGISSTKSKGVDHSSLPSISTTTTPLVRNGSNPTLSRLTDPPPLLPTAKTSTIQHNFYNHNHHNEIARNHLQGGIIRSNNNNTDKNSSSSYLFGGESSLNYPIQPQFQSLSQFHSENAQPQEKEERQLENFEGQQQHNKNNNLLLSPASLLSSFTGSAKSGKNQNFKFSQSEFFPGAATSQDFDISPMSSLPQGSVANDDAPLQKFKSSVLVNNNRAGGSEGEEYFRPSSPQIPSIPRQGGRNRKPHQNVTTVEISGDVGIVNSQAASAFLNHRRATLKKVNNESLWKEKNDVYSSGMSQLAKQREQQHSHDEEDNHYDGNRHATAGKVGNYEEADIRLVTDNGSSGSSESSTPKKSVSSSIEDDGDGSDWNSESTKNTVIFRGVDNKSASRNGSSSSESLPLLSPSSSAGGGGMFYNCDPEIHISSIDLLDNNEEDIGSGVTTDESTFRETTTKCVKATSAAISDSGVSGAKIYANSNNEALHDNGIIDKEDKAERKNVKSIDNIGNSSSNSDTSDRNTLIAITKRRQSVSSENSRKKSLTRSSDNVIKQFDNDLHSTSQQEPLVQMPEELEEDMVKCNLDEEIDRSKNAKSCPRAVPTSNNNVNNKSTTFHPRRESPEGQEQEVPTIHPDDDKVVVAEVPEKNIIKKKLEPKKSLRLGEVVIMENPSKGSSSGNNSKVFSKSEISQNALSRITESTSRSSPDGADADRDDSTTTTEPENDSPTPMVEQFDVTSDEDSWVEEIIFEEDDDTDTIQMCRKAQPPPLDLTLHTIVEESCEEWSEAESGNFNSPQKHGNQKQQRRLKTQPQRNDNELEKYFNFGINIGDNGSQEGGRQSCTNEDSEFSDTEFSESSFSMQDDHDHDQASLVGDNNNGRKQRASVEMDPAELASSRLEKYFYNLGLPQSMMNPISSINQTADSDSVGSESESDNSVLENRKKVLKHHRRSADFEDEFGDKVSDEEEDFGFGQDGFDTIKKTARKGSKKSGSDSNLLESCGVAPVVSGSSKISENPLSASSSNSACRPSLLHGESSSSNSNNTSRVIKNPLEKSFSNSTSSSKEDSSSTSPTSPPASKKSSPSGCESGGDREKDRPVVKVNRSNSFQWSSDEEVNIMMSKLRQLIRNLVKAKAEPSKSSGGTISGAPVNYQDKDKQLAYLEGELIRLMKTENLKNIVEYFSSEESDVDDVYKFIKVVKESSSNADDNSDFGEIDLEDPELLHTLQTTMESNSAHISPKQSPELLAKVMNHIGNRLQVWMKDENMQDDDNNDDNVTLKCAQSVSSDLNEDRFSWKGSFESALAAKRQSVGSTDSISSSDFPQDRSILRSSSLHHLANSLHHLGQVEEHKDEEESTSSLPRMTNLCNSNSNSLPRLNQTNNLSISRAYSLVMPGGKVDEVDSPVTPTGPIKSARYRPPGFNPIKSKRSEDEGVKPNSILSQSTPILTQDPGLKARSDSVGSIFHDATKPHIPVKGQVEFGLQYNYKLACLEVRVSKCRELAAVDAKRNRSDPYVKAYLLPDRSKGGKRKTKVKKNTLNPIFEEILKFPLTLSDLQNRTLWLSVWHSDMFGKNIFLGEVLVELKDRVFDDPNPQPWDLQEMSGQTEDMSRGDVVIALKWQPKTDSTGKLSVLVKEATLVNLTPVKNGGSPSSLIKCSLLSDKSRKHKTSICRRSYNPVWNQTLTFDDAGDDGLEITLWNHDLLSNNDLLGNIRMEYDHPLWSSMLSRHSFWVEGILRLN
ncbi:uncharacterized protein LOC110854038 isoform X4 [Folsomia candida]|uniref:uncharacterized protein LOC110854038 isoform X4 n=1 Tax=Folsomia candida TaxID=158441 RepID=UPI001605077E|nr:uncharacterized protein LOC110854038 isoform X4 [Folsomia candida]